MAEDIKKHRIRNARYRARNKFKIQQRNKDSCPECGEDKQKSATFCRRCYIELKLKPRLMRENDKRYREYEELGV
jgi:hypothetical protein